MQTLILRALHNRRIRFEEFLVKPLISINSSPPFQTLAPTNFLGYHNSMIKDSSSSPFPPEAGHLPSGLRIRDVVLGMNDGMVTLTSFLGGISGAPLSHTSILYAGLMTSLAGSLSMGAGALLATQSQNDLIRREIARERWEIAHVPELEKQEVYNLFISFGLPPEESHHITERIVADPEVWHRFMVREELGIHEEAMESPVKSAATLSLSFMAGALPPLLPYFFFPKAYEAFSVALVLSLLTLAVTGSIKSRLAGESPFKGAGEMILLGGAAAAAGLFLGEILPRFFHLS